MSLFPAYSGQSGNDLPKDSPLIALYESSHVIPERTPSPEPAMEDSLLESDESVDETNTAVTTEQSSQCTTFSDDFYIDKKLDRGNLRVSTLYYPGRPEYHKPAKRIGSDSCYGHGREKKTRRYYDLPNHDIINTLKEELEEINLRIEKMQKELQKSPKDIELWLEYIGFQERWVGAEAGLSAAAAALERFPAPPPALVTARRRLARLALTHHDYMDLLQQDIKLAPSPEYLECARLWAACGELEGGGGGAGGALAAAAAAAPRLSPAGYVHLLYHYGSFLSSAGLSEQLVVLVELLLAMNFSAAASSAPPPPRPPPAREEQLARVEDAAAASRLPLWAVWGRVERARAAAHWSPAGVDAGAGGDWQRCASAADAAELVRALADDAALFALAVHMLRWAGVPLMTAGVECSVYDALHGAAGGGAGGLSAAAARVEARHAAALLPLLLAAWQVVGAGGGAGEELAGAAALLAGLADPPHYFTDEHGYLSWVLWVWRTAAGGLPAAAAAALRCWQLRWLRALLLLTHDRGEQARLRRVARDCVPSAHEATPLLAALAAALRGDCAGEAPRGGGGSAAARGERALAGLMAALAAGVRDPDTPHTHLLYIARVVCEECGARSAAARWALLSAVCRRAPPAAAASTASTAPPPRHLLRDAQALCIEKCSRLQALSEEGSGEWAPGWVESKPWLAFMPQEDEWLYAADALLDTPLNCKVSAGSWLGARCLERGAELAATSASPTTPTTPAAHLYPHNVRIALAEAQRPVWRRGAGAGACPPGRLVPAPRPAASPARALAAALSPLLRAYAAPHDHDAWARCSRVLSRLCGGGGGGGARAGCAAGEWGGAGAETGALLWAARGEVAARAGRPVASLVRRALDHYPHHKWLYGRAVSWLGGAGGARGEEGVAATDADWEELIDILIEKQLRLHALPQELTPL